MDVKRERVQARHGRRAGAVVLLVLLFVQPASLGFASHVSVATRSAIRELADRHADSGGSLQTELAIRLYHAKGLPDAEIAATYEREFLRRRATAPPKSSDLPELVSRYGVLVGLFVLAAFALGIALRDLLAKMFLASARYAVDVAHRSLAGRRLMRRAALKRYRANLSRAVGKLQIPFRPNRSLDLSRIYVPPQLVDETGLGTPLQALRRYRRVTVLGPPGAGKSMLMRRLALDFSTGSPSRGIADQVVLVELRRLAIADVSLEEFIISEFDRYGFPRSDQFVARALTGGRLLVLLDALDEVPTAERARVALSIGEFLEKYPEVPAIVTCRDAIYGGEVDGAMAATVSILEFDDKDITRFLDAWKAEFPDGRSPAQMMAALHDHPPVAAVARNPLMLTILVRLYCDVPGYVLPTSRTQFYDNAADVLLEQWHKESNAFSPLHKRAVLRHIASTAQQSASDIDSDRRTIRFATAVAGAREILPELGLEASAALALITEVVERSGLLLAIDGGERLQFAHQTWQEFFAAEALRSSGERLVQNFESDPTAWREVVKFWCGLADDCTELVHAVRQVDANLALACVPDAARVDDALADELLDTALAAVIAGKSVDADERAVGSVAADSGPRGRRVLQRLVDDFQAADPQAASALARCLSYSSTPQAVTALSRRYELGAAIREGIVRLGDLAAGELQALAQVGSRPALDDLATIGSPSCMRALAELVGHETESIARPAAWRAAEAIRSREVLTSLTQSPIELTDLERDRDYLWLADSGHFPVDEPIRRFVARLSRLIDETPANELPKERVTVHPALSAPLCGIKSAKLQQAAGQSVSKELLAAANEMFGRKVFTAENGGFRASYSRETSKISPGRLLEYSPLGDGLEISAPPVTGRVRGELLVGVVSEMASVSADSGCPKEETVDKFLRAYVERTGCSARTIALLNGMPTCAKILVLHGLAGARLPSSEQWSRGYAKPIFGPRWVFQTARLATLLLMLLAIVGCARWTLGATNPLSRIAAVAVAGIALPGAVLLLLAIFRTPFAYRTRSLGLTVVVGPLAIWLELVETIRGRTTIREFGRLATVAGLAPGIVVLTIKAVAPPAPIGAALLAWGVLVVAFVARLWIVSGAGQGRPALRDVDIYLASHRPDSSALSSLEHLLMHARASRHREPSVTEPVG